MAHERFTTGDMARRLGVPLVTVTNIVQLRNIKHTEKIGHARVYDLAGFDKVRAGLQSVLHAKEIADSIRAGVPLRGYTVQQMADLLGVSPHRVEYAIYVGGYKPTLVDLEDQSLFHEGVWRRVREDLYLLADAVQAEKRLRRDVAPCDSFRQHT